MWLLVLLVLVAVVVVAGISTWTTLQNAYVGLLLRMFDYARVIIDEAHHVQEAAERAEAERSPRCCTTHLGLTATAAASNWLKDAADKADIERPARALRSRSTQSSLPRCHQLPHAAKQAQSRSQPELSQQDVRKAHTYVDCLEDCCTLITKGMRVILEDEVTPRFASEELKSWNLLSRHLNSCKHLSWRLMALWMFGLVVRYMLLFPVRITFCTIAMIWLSLSTAVLGQLPTSKWKRRLVAVVTRQCFRTMACSLSAVLRFHNSEYRPSTGICVSNHTSPLDVLVLMCDTNFSLIGQRHGGCLGIIQRALSRVSPHMWFDRSESRDRQAVSGMLRAHIASHENPPLLIFPEGTCINNTSVMKFKKGSFEASEVICPVAMKYDRRFGDAFWDSGRYSIMHYVIMMISSWAIVCDIWYMQPMCRQEGESAIDFASRVKAAIAKQAGIEDLDWDGNLKRWNPQTD